jgi:hypothetical protein
MRIVVCWLPTVTCDGSVSQSKHAKCQGKVECFKSPKVRHLTIKKFQRSKHISLKRPDLNMQILPSVIRALLCFSPVWGDTSVTLGSSGEREKGVMRVSQ